MRASHASPTGIDRVERAYLDWAFQQTRYELAFICRIRGGQAMFDRDTAEAIYRETALRPIRRSGFAETAAERRLRRYLSQARAFLRSSSWFRTIKGGKAAFAKLGIAPEQAIFLNVSHNNVDPWALGVIKGIGVAKVAALIHDVIPEDYPEFVSGDGVRRFKKKLDALAEHCDAFIFNSDYTAERTLARLNKRVAKPRLSAVAHLGLSEVWREPDTPAGPPPSDHPYFVTLGTIEPRKNHLLLLNVWRRLAEEMDDPPHLHIIGWRGWENENILDFLDRSPIMNVCVFEHPSDSDDRVRAWMAGARAALYPSFVEGFGIPVIEAIASGTPILCSDIAVLREVGRGAPDYIDPLDGPGWVAHVKAYAEADHPLRLAQLARLASYTPPSWEEHFEKVARLLRAMDVVADPSDTKGQRSRCLGGQMS